MPRTRRTQLESAYERRIRRYLQAHPGATRQEARGHKPPKGKSEYRQRIERYKRRHPGASTKEASGKAPAEHEVRVLRGRLLTDFIDYLQPGDGVQLADHISVIRRQDDGRWEPFRKLVIPSDETRPAREFLIPAMTDSQLRDLIEDELARGALLSPIPSLDQRRLL